MHGVELAVGCPDGRATERGGRDSRPTRRNPLRLGADGDKGRKAGVWAAIGHTCQARPAHQQVVVPGSSLLAEPAPQPSHLLARELACPARIKHSCSFRLQDSPSLLQGQLVTWSAGSTLAGADTDAPFAPRQTPQFVDVLLNLQPRAPVITSEAHLLSNITNGLPSTPYLGSVRNIKVPASAYRQPLASLGGASQRSASHCIERLSVDRQKHGGPNPRLRRLPAISRGSTGQDLPQRQPNNVERLPCPPLCIPSQYWSSLVAARRAPFHTSSSRRAVPLPLLAAISFLPFALLQILHLCHLLHG